MTLSKVSFGQTALEVGATHIIGFVEIHSRMPTQQYAYHMQYAYAYRSESVVILHEIIFAWKGGV